MKIATRAHKATKSSKSIASKKAKKTKRQKCKSAEKAVKTRAQKEASFANRSSNKSNKALGNTSRIVFEDPSKKNLSDQNLSRVAGDSLISIDNSSQNPLAGSPPSHSKEDLGKFAGTRKAEEALGDFESAVASVSDITSPDRDAPVGDSKRGMVSDYYNDQFGETATQACGLLTAAAAISLNPALAAGTGALCGGMLIGHFANEVGTAIAESLESATDKDSNDTDAAFHPESLPGGVSDGEADGPGKSTDPAGDGAPDGGALVTCGGEVDTPTDDNNETANDNDITNDTTNGTTADDTNDTTADDTSDTTNDTDDEDDTTTNDDDNATNDTNDTDGDDDTANDTTNGNNDATTNDTTNEGNTGDVDNDRPAEIKVNPDVTFGQAFDMAKARTRTRQDNAGRPTGDDGEGDSKLDHINAGNEIPGAPSVATPEGTRGPTGTPIFVRDPATPGDVDPENPTVG